MEIKLFSGKILCICICLVAKFAPQCESAATVELSVRTPCRDSQPCCLICKATSGSVQTGFIFKLSNVDMVICPVANQCVSNFPNTFRYTRVNSTTGEGCILDFMTSRDIGNWSCSDGPGPSNFYAIETPGSLNFVDNMGSTNPVELQKDLTLTCSTTRSGMPKADIVTTDPASRSHTSESDADSVTITPELDGSYKCSFRWEEFPDYPISASASLSVIDPGKGSIATALCSVLGILSISCGIFAIALMIISFACKDAKVTRPVYIGLMVLSALTLVFVIVVGAYNLGEAMRTVALIPPLYNASIAFIVIGIIVGVVGIIVAARGLM